jgi:hypothetical protein
MRTATWTFPERSFLTRLSAIILCAWAVLGWQASAHAQQTFKSPEEAADQLAAAVRSDNPRQILTVLGRNSRDILFSGDSVADEKSKAMFLAAFDARHQVVKKGDNAAELLVGPGDWPLPIPLVAKNGSWEFDTARGRQEILFRRIGRNELEAIQVVLAYVDAQNDYASMNPEKNPTETYAQHFISSAGKKDGLYWPASASEPQSPLGEAFTHATLSGYRLTGEPTPYHGYFYKILTAQGSTAPGGAVNYIVNGKMIGGFALIAYPAEYGNSGVMTFLVNYTGTIFQKDLGDRTEKIAARMTTFNPDHTWKKVPEGDLTALR